MKYELIPKSYRGVLVDRTPIMQDVRDTFEVSFVLPDKCGYIALFKDEDGIEYRKIILDGVCKVPKEILKREQYVEFLVCKIDGENIVHTWACEPLRITSMYAMQHSQWQISGGMTENTCLDRLVELERVFAKTLEDFSALHADYVRIGTEMVARIDALNANLCSNAAALERTQKDHTNLSAAYNKAIGVVNDLSKRVLDIEKNYDPTLI